MDNTISNLDQEDDQILLGDLDFSNEIFDLEEPIFPEISSDFLTPTQIINNNFDNYENLTKNGSFKCQDRTQT